MQVVNYVWTHRLKHKTLFAVNNFCLNNIFNMFSIICYANTNAFYKIVMNFIEKISFPSTLYFFDKAIILKYSTITFTSQHSRNFQSSNGEHTEVLFEYAWRLTKKVLLLLTFFLCVHTL